MIADLASSRESQARRRVLLIGTIFCTVIGILGCTGSPQESSSPGPLRVFAAASLNDVVETLLQDYDSPVVPNFGASSALARQIRDGAPADVFLSASPQWIDYLREEKALEGEPIVVARNHLVVIAPPGSALAAARPADLRTLLDHLAPDDGVAIADAGVPAGEYARAALDSMNLSDTYQPRLIGLSDVRAVLHVVEQAQLPAGFVYATDAGIAEVEVLFTIDPAAHSPIEYHAAMLSNANNVDTNADAARAFLEYLTSDTARAHLAAAGFTLP